MSQKHIKSYASESREVSLDGGLYDFWVDYNSIEKSDILNIYKNLMTKNNIMFTLLNKCLLCDWILVAI